MEVTLHATNLKQFRHTLYQNLDNRADSLMELLDAMCSKPDAKSVVEYSLAESYRRSYSTIFKAIDGLHLKPMWLPHLLAPYLPRPQQRPYWLLMLDVTPCPRPFARTLKDRGMVYQPEVVKGKLPVTIGHQFSTVVMGLEPEARVTASWVLPLMTKRVRTADDKEKVGAQQIECLLQDPELPFGQELTVEVGDGSYSKAEYLHAHRKFPKLVTIARVRGNRTFYHRYVPTAEEVEKSGRGHPTWYGKPFPLSDPTRWTEADETLTLQETSRRGKVYRVVIESWHNMLMPGKNQPKLPMHEHPFTLVRIVRYDQDGTAAFKHPLWVIVMGERRHDLTLRQIYQAYLTRFDIEHFFRFGKQRLLMTAFQTPEVTREENWWQLTHIAYAQLWLARHLAHATPRPWERNLSASKQRRISPTLVQRDFARIIRQLGTPAQSPKPRGISPGRRPGTQLTPRPRQNVVLKRSIAPTIA
jgi:hypothetical protein